MITSYFKPKPKGSTGKLSTSSPSTNDTPFGSSPTSSIGSACGTSSTSSSKRLREQQDQDIQNSKRLKESSKMPSSLPDPVREVLSFLDAHCDDGGADNTWTWKNQLDDCFRGPAFAKLASFVASERKSYTVYPPPADTFAALNLCPLKDVKVVIVGQDPYHGPHQAHGLSFSVERGQAVPPSLKNIYKELRDDPEIGNSFRTPSHGCLRRWAKQGVLLLNACLTVRRGQPNSHAQRGWEAVTDHVLRAVDRHSRYRGRGVVFLLWGKPAAAKARGVLAPGSTRHTVLCTSHPSPLGATKTNQPFLGSRCFSRCNRALVQMGLNPIDWNVNDPSHG